MKKLLLVLAIGAWAATAFAQSVAPLTGKEQITAELARSVSPGWGNKNTWRDGAPAEVSWTREADGLEVITGPTEAILIDPKTFLHYVGSNAGIKEGNVWKLRPTLSASNSRKDQPLEPGISWKAARVSEAEPVSWCANTKSNMDSSFEVGSKVPYALTVDGKSITVEVVPIVEKGWWTRCYSGKRYTRFLVSKELGAIVSVEHIGYTPTGDVHESSYRLSFREIRHP